MRDRVSVRAIAIGVLAGQVLANITGIIPTVIAMISLMQEGVVRQDMDLMVATSLLWERILSSPSLMTSILVSSGSGDFLSGYLAGRLARSNELLHGIVVSVTIIAWNLTIFLLISPLRAAVLFSFLAVPAAISGALLARARRRRMNG